MSLPVHLLTDLGKPAPGDLLRLTGDEGHHAVAVRRLRVGEGLVITDGRGAAATCVVEAAERRELIARCETFAHVAEPSPRITLVQALAKGERAELAVELATELGVSRIVPWAASRSVSVWREDRAVKGALKWRSTAREAAKQSRRSWFPEVTELASSAVVSQLVRECAEAGGSAYCLHEAAESSLAARPLAEEIVLIVGPEGGLTEDEVGRFEDAGAVAVRLGPEVLRTSTAGAAGLVTLLSRTERWGGRG